MNARLVQSRLSWLSITALGGPVVPLRGRQHTYSPSSEGLQPYQLTTTHLV
jgi:hypothetical protein